MKGKRTTRPAKQVSRKRSVASSRGQSKGQTVANITPAELEKAMQERVSGAQVRQTTATERRRCQLNGLEVSANQMFAISELHRIRKLTTAWSAMSANEKRPFRDLAAARSYEFVRDSMLTRMKVARQREQEQDNQLKQKLEGLIESRIQEEADNRRDILTGNGKVTARRSARKSRSAMKSKRR